MIASRPSVRSALVAVIVLGSLASVGCRTPGARPVGRAVDPQAHFSRRVPDVADYAAAELATAALVSDREGTERLLRRIRAIDTVLDAAGEKPTGLDAIASDLANATLDGPRSYKKATVELLEEGELDDAMRERLRQAEQDDPLELADARIRDARMIAFARIFNALSEPVGRSILTMSMAPYRLARSLVNYALILYGEDKLPLQRRQALAHWKEFVARYPDTPEAEELRPLIERADGRLKQTLHDRTLSAAEKALEVGQSRLALVYADRALRYLPEDAKAESVRSEAEKRLRKQREKHRLSLEGAPELHGSLAEEVELSVALLDPRADLGAAASALLEADPDGPLADEARFAAALAKRDDGHVGEMFDALEDLSEADVDQSNMARHAAAIFHDPAQNPYNAYEIARWLNRKHQTLWVFFGPFARGLPDRGVPKPLGWLVDLPSVAQNMGNAPLRLLQLPWLDALPAAKMAAVYARWYLERYPEGERAHEMRDWIVSLEKKRGNWIGVLQVARGDPDFDPEDLQELREKSAEQAMEFAHRENRRDLRTAMYRRIAREFSGTEAGQEAGEAARFERGRATPQRIRISRGFLEENREFAGPLGAGLDPELLDGDSLNGELHPLGIELIGARSLLLHFVGESGDPDDPSIEVFETVSEERFGRLVAQLEETSFENALLDTDDELIPDAHRDVFFERARVGLADEIDRRPLAGSTFTYIGMRERYGLVRAREPILPFDLVIQGSLNDMSVGAFPRMRMPRETPDAFLYR